MTDLDDCLDALREIGDPELAPVDDALLRRLVVPSRGEEEPLFAALQAALKTPVTMLDPLPDALAGRLLDLDRVAWAQRLFATFSTEISGALLLAALPQMYATTWGARVLKESTGLNRTNLARRIFATAQFLLVVMMGDWRPHAGTSGDRPSITPSMRLDPYVSCLALRMFHEAERRKLTSGGGDHHAKFNGLPINQEDLLGTLLSFSVVVFEVLEQFGITWSADDQDAYMYLWDVVGECLGIGTECVHTKLREHVGDKAEAARTWLRPSTAAEARRILDRMRRRQWQAPPDRTDPLAPITRLRPGQPDAQSFWDGLRAGRVLARALIHELAMTMPPTRRRLPLAVMRQLAPPVVRSRLALGGGGVVMGAVALLPKRRHVVDRFTQVTTPNPVGARVLRVLAGDVTQRASLAFVEAKGIRIPGLDDYRGAGGSAIG